MNELKIYNTLTRKKEVFCPINSDEVKIYTCGPTVYNYASIGNFKSYLFMDTLRRVLKYNGYKLKHVMNITDVGHLVSDADEGEDKMLVASKRENKNPYEIAELYMNKFLEDMDKLNIERPEIIARATKHIDIMEEYVKKIIENGYAYETKNTIYFDTSKLDKYGVLSNQKLDEQIAGARVELDNEKKNPTDFALWIKAPEEHIMKWDSFWGKCYPGWHLECSAMGYKYLGEKFDIHTGGIDHIPIHHENEIAQAKGYCGKIPANYWMHVEFLQIDGGKMSKSLNNVYTLDDLKERGYEPEVYKLFNFSSHYRKKLNFTFEAMDSAKISLNRLKEGYLKHINGNENASNEQIDKYKNEFVNAINDDLNMPLAISVIWDILKNPVKSKQFAKLIDEFDNVLGLNIAKIANTKEEMEVPKDVLELLEKRNNARKEKNWNESDKLRDIILQKGYIVKDNQEGTKLEKI